MNATVTNTTCSLPRFTVIDTGRPLTDAILTALGGHGLDSAIALTGGVELQRHENDGRLPGRTTSIIDDDYIDAEVFVRWRVNAGRHRCWLMHVALEPDDTFTVRLIRIRRGVGAGIEPLGERTDVHAEDLIHTCDLLYTDAVNTHLGGLIPID
jgi:hypothetical protein